MSVLLIRSNLQPPWDIFLSGAWYITAEKILTRSPSRASAARIKNINQPKGWFFIAHSPLLIVCKFNILKNLLFNIYPSYLIATMI